MITYRRPATIGQTTYKLQAPCFIKQAQRAYQGCVGALRPLYTLWVPWKKQQINGTTYFTSDEQN